jgi:predicted RNase H-like nuclease
MRSERGTSARRLRIAWDQYPYVAAGAWLIEVYPHAALIEFLRESERLPYKAAKTLTYWPDLPVKERRWKLRVVWTRIVEALDRRIAGVAAALAVPPLEVRGWRLKAHEDKLDAVVCAAVAIAALNGEAVPHGDAEGAIWVPTGGEVA